MKRMKSPMDPFIGVYPGPTRLLAEWASLQDVCANNPVNQQMHFIGELDLELSRLHEVLLRVNKI